MWVARLQRPQRSTRDRARIKNSDRNGAHTEHTRDVLERDVLAIRQSKKNMIYCNTKKKLDIRPSKSSYDLLHDKVTSRYQIFRVGKAYDFLGVRAIPKKPLRNETQQLTGTENWEGLCFFLARIDTQEADTCRDSHSISMQCRDSHSISMQ